VFAVLQATQFESVLQAALYAYTVYGAAVTPAVLAVFFWRRSTAAGAVSSIVLGTIVTVAWELLQQHGQAQIRSTIGGIDAVYPALLISVFSLVAVSLCTRPTITKDDDRPHTRSPARQQT
jgi:SSS family solute:Na+ symporter/sodium/proline symporter